MTDKEVFKTLQKLLQKAIDSKIFGLKKGLVCNNISKRMTSLKHPDEFMNRIEYTAQIIVDSPLGFAFTFTLADLIDNDDFMRAVCGSEKYCHMQNPFIKKETCLICSVSKVPYPNCHSLKGIHCYHQQQLIILSRSEQIRYLKRFMEVGK